jgi:hypothetical protein
MTFIARFVIFNSRIAMIVNPQFANNNIVHRRCHFAPRIVITTFGKFNMRMTDRKY